MAKRPDRFSPPAFEPETSSNVHNMQQALNEGKELVPVVLEGSEVRRAEEGEEAHGIAAVDVEEPVDMDQVMAVLQEQQQAREAKIAEPVVLSTVTETTAPGTITPEILRAIANQGNPLVELPDGSVSIQITVPEEMVPIIREWAAGADEAFHPYLQKLVETSLYATVMGGDVTSAR